MGKIILRAAAIILLFFLPFHLLLYSTLSIWFIGFITVKSRWYRSPPVNWIPPCRIENTPIWLLFPSRISKSFSHCRLALAPHVFSIRKLFFPIVKTVVITQNIELNIFPCQDNLEIEVKFRLSACVLAEHVQVAYIVDARVIRLYFHLRRYLIWISIVRSKWTLFQISRCQTSSSEPTKFPL